MEATNRPNIKRKRSFKMNSLEIRKMNSKDVEMIFRELDRYNIGKPMNYISKCWEENKTEDRITLIAFYDHSFSGWLHLLTTSYYPLFAEKGIPEINNFDVVPPLQRLGIGNALMDAIEKIAFEKFGVVGIGVGMFADYGNAQRIYAKRGYIPDGRGIMYKNRPVEPGSNVCVDHDLVLYMTKEQG
jgi:GNAT superfamily N-acetyltransferase